MANTSLEEEILRQLESDLVEIVRDKVDEEIKGEFNQVAVDEWYNTYPKYYSGNDYPRVYNRRYGTKGLIDEERMETMITYSGKEGIKGEFYSFAKTNPYNNDRPIYPSLESKDNLVDYLADRVYPEARRVDLIEETARQLDSKNTIEKTVVSALKSKGYDVK